MKTQLYLYLILLFGLLAACQQNAPSDLFRRIEDCMETYPDSALMLLDQTPHPERLSGKQRADYALLLTQARDKNFLDSLQSDSLIKIAVDYYKDSKDDIKIGKTLFYYGRVMMMQDNDTVAIQAFLDAQTRLENTKEFKMLGLIKEYIGYLNDNRGLQDVALANYRQSVDLYFKAKDTLGAIYAYRNMAWFFDDKQSIDSTNIYLNKGICLLKRDSTVSVLPSLLHLKGIMLRKKGNYTEAINCFSEAIKYEKRILSTPFYYFSLGDLYMKIGNLNKAEDCFKQGIPSEETYTQGSAYHQLYLLEKHRDNHIKALFYKERADSLFDIYQNEKSASDVLKIQQKHKRKELLTENKLLKKQKRSQLYLEITVLVILVFFCFISYLWIKKQNRKKYRKQLKKYVAKVSGEIETNKQTIEQYYCQIKELQQQDIQMKEKTKNRIDSLNQQIVILKNENLKNSNTGFNILNLLKTNKLIKSSISNIEIIQLFEYIDLVLENFATRLREEYDLNESYLLLAILIRLNFSVEQLAFIFDYETGTIYTKKKRLKTRLQLRKEDDLNDFLRYFSLKSYRLK